MPRQAMMEQARASELVFVKVDRALDERHRLDNLREAAARSGGRLKRGT